MSKHYINNKRFEELIELYLVDPQTHEDELFQMFDLLIDNILMSFKFNVDHEDAKQDCFYLILRTLKKFKSRKGTAFNYFTTVIVNNLKLNYTKDKRYRNKIEEYIERNKENVT